MLNKCVMNKGIAQEALFDPGFTAGLSTHSTDLPWLTNSTVTTAKKHKTFF